MIILNQWRERKGLNTICHIYWCSLLELGSGVTTHRLPESKDVSLSTRVRVRVMFTIN